MIEERENAQTEIHNTCMEMLDVRGFDRYSRDEARSQLGKNWTNLCTVYLSDAETTGNIRECVNKLEELGYIANAELKDERFVIEVSQTRDGFTKHKE